MKLDDPLGHLRKGWSKIEKMFHRGEKDLTTEHVLKVTRERTLPNFRQWKRLPEVLTKTELLFFRLALGTLVVAFIFIGAWYGVNHREEVPAVGGEYTEGLVGEPQFVNPLYSIASDVDADLAQLVFSGLFKFDPVNGLVPDLAASYEISEDQTIYTVTIREDAKWHDGEPVRASDVVFTIQAIQNPEYKSPLSVSFKNIGVAQVDEKTFQFILPEPFAPFLSSLTVGILPSHIWESVAPKRATLTELNLTPIGSGPYKFDVFTKDKLGNIGSYTLIRNTDYYAQAPMIEQLTFKFYNTSAEALQALENKNVEGLGFVPTDLAEEISGLRGVNMFRPGIPQVSAIFFNLDSGTEIEEVNIRTALTHALNRDQIVSDILGGNGTVINAPILPGMLGYHKNVTVYEYSQEAANNLFDEEGWTWNENAPYRSKTVDGEETELTFTLTVLDQPEFISSAEIIKEQWMAVGVKTEIRVVGATELNATVLTGRKYEMFFTGELMGIDPDPFPFWHSSQATDSGLNLSNYTNRNVDELLEEARITTDPIERATKYIEFQDLLTEDVPAVFLYQPTYRYALPNKIQNVTLDQINTPADRFGTISEWYVKTKMSIIWPWQINTKDDTENEEDLESPANEEVDEVIETEVENESNSESEEETDESSNDEPEENEENLEEEGLTE